ncbi:MAG: pitrilysin family protein, partial [Bacteroidota bacterium]
MKYPTVFAKLISACLLISLLYLACTPKTKSILPNEVPIAPQSVPIADYGYDPNAPIPKDTAVRMGTLANGMKYFLRYNQKPEDRVEIRLALNAGSMQEDEDQLGIAHFVEHMAFNGSKNFKKNELVDYLESVGTRFGPDLNAYTSFDETVYMLQTRTDDPELLDKGLLIFEDWAVGLAFEPEEIDKERGVVVAEWRSSLSPRQRLMNKYFPVMYQGSRYAKRLPIGDPEIIQNADYATIKRFYQDWYRPDLMAIVLVGDMDLDEMEAEIVRRFSALKNPEVLRPVEEYPVPPHSETLVAIHSDPEAPFTNVQLMYKHDFEAVKTIGDYRNIIIQILYNNMLDSRLDELAQQPNAPFNYAYTGYSRDVGQLATYSSWAMTPEGTALRCLEALLEENQRVLQHGFTATELERTKADLLNGMERAYKERDKTESVRFAMRYVYHFLDD